FISKNENFWFKLEKLSTKINEVECYNVTILDRFDDEIEACFNLNKTYWFGGHESYDQPYWPINSQRFDYVPYVTGFADDWSAVLERYWISSNGISLFVDDDIALLVKHTENNTICLKSSKNSNPYKFTSIYSNLLQYTLCKGTNIKTLQLYMIEEYLGKPENKPDLLMMKYPIFTTWNYFFRNINQSIILDYAEDIRKNNYTASQLEIDDKWEVHYGDLDFDLSKFPSPKEMSEKLHDMGMRVTIWVHPFCNIDSFNFVPGIDQSYWVLDSTGEHPGFTKWWNGKNSVIIDTTNPNSIDYFRTKLNFLKNNYKIDSFKFDAGETAWIPKSFQLYDKNSHPDVYAQNYAKFAAEEQGKFLEIRVGHRTQNLGVFYRILDRATDWSIHDGIKSVITQTLQFGILGYPFVLPDIIGGNDDPNIKNKELFIRWTQLTAFLPTMQFGVPPWFFDEETNKICKIFVDLHTNFIFPYISNLPIDGQPIIRPMWWLEPLNEIFFNISDQFLVGDDILVAPILDQGKTSRLIYFPGGNWYDLEKKEYIAGPVKLEINADLYHIPYYINEKGLSKFDLNF
ncbi:unnamed protein product, partial [Brachionus calyciflorus]